MPQPSVTSSEPTSILKQDSQQNECASPSSYLGLSQTVSPRTTPKSVSIAPHAETISPLILGKQKSVDELQLENASSHCWRLPVRGPASRRLSGRPATTGSPSLQPTTPRYVEDEGQPSLESGNLSKQIESLVNQVSAWIRDHRLKHATRKSASHTSSDDPTLPAGQRSAGLPETAVSDASDISLDLDRLESILKQTLKIEHLPHRRSVHRVRRPSLKKLRASTLGASSDTECHDSDILVPSCDAVLDNSCTLATNSADADLPDDSSYGELTRAPSYRDFDAGARFKLEIVRLTHTLRLKGWRRVPMDMSEAISVERLSGALTNAVYVVSPPKQLPEPQDDGIVGAASQKRSPQKLLLRVYGPQVEHLIDREAELQILQRLALKSIGPRLLGTFANGRFEEYFHAQTLTPDDLRNPETSRQIAKRMRELHDGVELLDHERDSGPFVWRNWDKWVQRVDRIVTWLDAQVKATKPEAKLTAADTWKYNGFVCGLEWRHFRRAVEKYRAWLEAQYGGSQKLREQLVFAHNDTQYGNILRIVPPGGSPLLVPANTHKQLVVIDFEYSNANLPGQEFANHFTEWCYNYHDKRMPYACHTSRYPVPEEQDRFIRAYVRHRPQFNVSTPKLGPQTPGTMPGETPRRSTSSISTFMLDARNPYPPGQASKYDEAAEKAAEDTEVARLRHETRIWRLANTAQWVAWGIVQAKVPGMPEFGPAGDAVEAGDAEPAERAALEEMSEDYRAVTDEQQAAPAEEDQEEFDYLGYSQQRAMFFWGDALQLGIVKPDSLPEEVRARVKTVPF